MSELQKAEKQAQQLLRELDHQVREAEDFVVGVGSRVEERASHLPEQKQKQLKRDLRSSAEEILSEAQDLKASVEADLQRIKEYEPSLSPQEKEMAEVVAAEIAEEIQRWCPVMMKGWEDHSRQRKKQILANKIRELERRLIPQENPPQHFDEYHRLLQSEWKYLQRTEKLAPEADEETKAAARAVQKAIHEHRQEIGQDPGVTDVFEEANSKLGKGKRSNYVKKLVAQEEWGYLAGRGHASEDKFESLITAINRILE